MGKGSGEWRSYIIHMAALLLSPSSGMPDSILSLRATSTPTSSSSMTISATLVVDLDDYPSNHYCSSMSFWNSMSITGCLCESILFEDVSIPLPRVILQLTCENDGCIVLFGANSLSIDCHSIIIFRRDYDGSLFLVPCLSTTIAFYQHTCLK